MQSCNQFHTRHTCTCGPYLYTVNTVKSLIHHASIIHAPGYCSKAFRRRIQAWALSQVMNIEPGYIMQALVRRKIKTMRGKPISRRYPLTLKAYWNPAANGSRTLPLSFFLGMSCSSPVSLPLDEPMLNSCMYGLKHACWEWWSWSCASQYNAVSSTHLAR